MKKINYPIYYLSTTSLQAKFAFGPYLLWGHLIEIVQNSISQSIFGVTNWDFVTRNVIVMPWMCKKHRSQILKFRICWLALSTSKFSSKYKILKGNVSRYLYFWHNEDVTIEFLVSKSQHVTSKIDWDIQFWKFKLKIN